MARVAAEGAEAQQAASLASLTFALKPADGAREAVAASERASGAKPAGRRASARAERPPN